MSEFIDRKIVESLPKQMVIDYDRLNQLENVCESVKTLLCVSDKEVSETANKIKDEYLQEIKESKAGLAEQTKRRIEAEQVAESLKAENLLLKKVSALPIAEQKVLTESFKGASVKTINENFDKEYSRLVQRRDNRPAVVKDTICESRKPKIEVSKQPVVESTKKVEDSDSQIITESTHMSDYVNICNKFKKFGL